MAMREKLIRFAETHHAEFRFLSQRAFRSQTLKSLKKLRTTVGRMETLFWFTGTGNRPLQRLAASVKTLCEVDGALKRAEDLSISSPSLKNLRKRWRRELRQILLPKNQKALSSKIAALVHSLREGKGLKAREKVADLRAELARWKRKDLSPNRDLSRLEAGLERARYLLEASEKSIDKLRALIKALHKTGELRALSASRMDEVRLRKLHHDSLIENGAHLDAVLKFARKKLKGI